MDVSGVELSLVIATRNRSGSLVRTLQSLMAHEARSTWELVIVDNGSTDDTRIVAEDFTARFPHSLRMVYEPKPGLGNARNAGWRAACAPIVAFTDDDCYPSPGHVDAIVQCFAEDQSLGYIGGRILLFDDTDYRITVQYSTKRAFFPPRSFIEPGIIQGCNFACRRMALADVGGFDPWFGPGARYNAEEVDLLARLSAKGWAGAYDPRPMVYHHHGRKAQAEVSRLMKSYDSGRGAYYVKCILDPRLRATYLKNWYWRIRRQKWRTTIREISAGITFLLRDVMNRRHRCRSL